MADPTAEQLDRLRMMAAGTIDPTLSDVELLDVLKRNAQPDEEGRRPDDDDWLPTYPFGAAAQDAWLLKAAKVAHRVTGSDGSLRLDRSDLHAHCLAMAEAYGRRRWGTIALAGTIAAEHRELLPAFNGPHFFPPPDPWVPGGAA